MTWADVSADGAGLTLITHGLQGLGGTQTLNLMLVRDVSDGGRPSSEGVQDRVYHTLRYAYLPHAGTTATPWRSAYGFNQPLIPVWKSGQAIAVQLPFLPGPPIRPPSAGRVGRTFPPSFSLISADNGIIADLYWRDDQIEAIMFAADPNTPTTLKSVGAPRSISPAPFTVIPVVVPSP
jgi:hypothetical protein